MKTIKTVIENKHLSKVLDVLDEAGVLGTTSQAEDANDIKSFKKVFKEKYTLLITTCSDHKKSSLVSKIFPLITVLGGICIA